jgi:hypothetical protein
MGEQLENCPSVRGVELLDYDLCRKAIVDCNLSTGHPRLMKCPSSEFMGPMAA